MHDLGRQLAQSTRSLARRPSFTAVVVLTLALGIGASTAVFSALHTVLLSSVPYPDPERLVFATSTRQGGTIGLSAHDYLDVRDQATSFESLGACLEFTVPLPATGGDRPETLAATFVSTNLFDTLGVAPQLGRGLAAGDGAPVAGNGSAEADLPAVAVISHALWQRRFAGSHAVLGQTLTLRGQAVSVVGVMPRGFRFWVDADVWLPLRLGGERATARRFHNWVAVGRLRPGLTRAAAQAEASAIAAGLEKAYPDSNTGLGIGLSGLREALAAGLRPQVLLVAAAGLLMLLIACTNVANLLLGRGIARRSEIAMRVALGAPPRRLVGQLLAEAVALAALGGVAGLGVAAALQRVLAAGLRLGGSRLGVASLDLDLGALLFAATVSLAVGVAVALVPALRAARVAPATELRSGGRTLARGSGARLRLALVSVQVAVSFALLIGAWLLVRSTARLTDVDLGFDAQRLMAAELALPSTTSGGERVAFFTGTLARIRALPGVSAAGMADRLPIVHPWGSTRAWAAEHAGDAALARRALGRIVLPGYFAAMGMPLVAGRDLADSDTAGAPPVLVISQAMGRALFGDRDPVGLRVAVDTGGDRPADLEVVGVVADARLNRPEDPPDPVMYLPYLQLPTPSLRVAVRGTLTPEAMTPALREVVWLQRPDVPVDGVVAIEEAIRSATLPQRTLAATVTAFAAVAVLLAAVGLLGVLAFQVQQREQEIGIRVALGARTGQVLALVLRQGLAATSVGLLAGGAGGLALSRLMRGLLYEVTPNDAASYLAAAACLLGVAVAACGVPTLRALHIQPVTALRYE